MLDVSLGTAAADFAAEMLEMLARGLEGVVRRVAQGSQFDFSLAGFFQAEFKLGQFLAHRLQLGPVVFQIGRGALLFLPQSRLFLHQVGLGFLGVAQALRDPADFGAQFVIAALIGIERLLQFGQLFALVFQGGAELMFLCRQRPKPGFVVSQLALMPLEFRLVLAPAQRQQLLAVLAFLVAQGGEFFRLFGLPLEAV